MADAQLSRRGQLNNVAAIDVHHAAQLRNNNGQKAIKVDCRWQRQREAIDNSFTRLMHLDFALERERLGGV